MHADGSAAVWAEHLLGWCRHAEAAADAVTLRRCCEEQKVMIERLQSEVECAIGSRQVAEAAATASANRAQAGRAEFDAVTLSLRKASTGF